MCVGWLDTTAWTPRTNSFYELDLEIQPATGESRDILGVLMAFIRNTLHVTKRCMHSTCIVQLFWSILSYRDAPDTSNHVRAVRGGWFSMFQLLGVLARVVQIFVRQQPHFCQHSKHGLNPSTRSLRHCASHKIHQKKNGCRLPWSATPQKRRLMYSGMWHAASFLMCDNTSNA